MKITNSTPRTLEIRIGNNNKQFPERVITQIPNAVNEVPACEGDFFVITEK